MKTVGYLGPKGTFTEKAFLAYAAHLGEQVTPYQGERISDLCRTIITGDCDEIVVPVENSIEGFVSATLDALVTQEKGQIIHEMILPIEHCLLIPATQSPDRVSLILSHPQALAQCSQYLEQHFPNVETLPVASTARAAQWVNDPSLRPQNLRDMDLAAIGGQRLAEIYGLSIAKRGINDVGSNRTRFFVIGHDQPQPTGQDKTSIAFTTVKDTPGILHHVLGEFAARNINLSHISSRPQKANLGEYRFFIDFDGHLSDRTTQAVLAAIKGKTLSLHILGCYPKGNLI